jgi:hypothetical protein
MKSAQRAKYRALLVPRPLDPFAVDPQSVPGCA